MIEWYNNRFANFSGRATRTEYVAWLLILIILYATIPYFIWYLTNNFILRTLINSKTLIFLLFIPFNAVTVRRIRDLGFNGGFVFLNFIPYVNLLLVICLLIFKGEDEKNAYGENPYAPKIIKE